MRRTPASRRARGRRATRLTVVAPLALSALLLAGCAIEGADEPTEDPTTEAPAVDPTLDPEGDAEQAFEYFRFVLAELYAEAPGSGGRSAVDALVDAGFRKGHLQLSLTTTPTGLDSDGYTVAVKWGESCLLAQRHNQGTTSLLAERLENGDCLIGQTRPIDW